MTIKEKISALLAKAKSTTHQGEADLYFAKVAELLEKHQLDIFELHEEDPIGCTHGVNAQPGPPSYKSNVQVALARYYGAKPVIHHTGGGKWNVRIFGPESSRITTELMTDFVWQQVNDAAAKLIQFSRAVAVRHVAKALVLRINQELVARKAQPVANGSAFSLMIVDATNALIKSVYPELFQIKYKAKTYNQSAMGLAKGISLNRQVGGSGATLRLQ